MAGLVPAIHVFFFTRYAKRPGIARPFFFGRNERYLSMNFTRPSFSGLDCRLWRRGWRPPPAGLSAERACRRPRKAWLSSSAMQFAPAGNG